MTEFIDPDTLLPVDNSTVEEDAPLVQDSRYYNVILWLPFVAIPLSIMLVRIVRYIYRIYLVKVYGYDDDLFSDPLAQLGLTLNRGYSNTTAIRKIRKEQKRLQSRQARSPSTDVPTSSRFHRPAIIANFAPLNKAEAYFAKVGRRTRRTWSQRLSPEAVRRWINTSRYSRLWMIFQVVCTLLAIINYVLLTYSIQRTDRKHIKYLDLFLASMFLIDYALSLYTAEDRLRAYFNPSALIDLVSIVPPFIYVLISETSQYVWFLGLLRILRASRILRTYRLLSFSETEEKRELTILALGFTNFVFLSASIINALESINAGSKDNPTLMHWHDSLYYIMVTFSTIGFGDLTPSSVPSRVVVMILIIIVIVFVPIQTGKLAEIYNSTSAFQRAKYGANSDHAHVIVGGTVTYTAVIDFCREYFVADPGGHVVLLAEREPSIDLRRLLRHPFYRNRVFYLRGTALSIPDLRRASAMYATAIFLLNDDSAESGSSANLESGEDEQLRVTRGADAQILMQALVAKNAFPGLPVFSEVQDIRSQDLSAHCGCDRILCVDEVKMSIIARNCLVPGVLTLLLNLVHTYRDDAGVMDDSNHGWVEEYRHGAGHQIYTFRFPPGLVGVRFTQVVKEVYATFGATVFAVMSINAGFNTNPIRLNPGANYRIRDDDVAFCTTDGGDEVMLRIGLQYRDSALRNELFKGDLEKEMDTVMGIRKDGGSVEPRIEILRTEETSPKKLEVSTPMKLAHPASLGTAVSWEALANGDTSVDASIDSHIILCGTMTSRGIRHFVRSVRSSGITLGTQGGATSSAAIVCLLEQTPNIEADGIWGDILQHPNVHIVRGTPLKKTSLIQAGVERCARLVVFLKGTKGYSGSSQDLPDANSIFIIKMVQKEWPQVPFVVELVNGSNVKFFSTKAGEWDTNNLRMQSILNNYALTVGDRLALYKKVRTEHARENGGFFYKLLQLAMSENQSKRKQKRSIASRRRQSKFRGGMPVPDNDQGVDDKEDLIFNAEEEDEDDNEDQDVDDLTGAPAGGDEEEPVAQDSGDNISPTTGGPPVATSPSSPAAITEPTTTPAETSITSAYLNRLVEEAELNETGLSPFPAYHFDRLFAGGMVTTSCFMHSLLCQSYFRPYIVDAVRALAGAVVHVPVADVCKGKRYGDVVVWCLEKGYVPLGLYRAAREERDGDVSMPYVYTNARAFDVVHADDLVFAIKETL
ncbi:hypothetical protein HK104_008842 [Borealophlyctis nickersoniae]|nr:hypothetical protein HK104_008842 [Borealophlyctis nickersoniae]